MVVAIDGPAGVGKSSLAARVADDFGFLNLNSGAFYRAVAVKVLEGGVDTSDADAVVAAAASARLDLVEGRLFLDGEDVEGRLRTDAVDHWSSALSAIVPLRHVVNAHLRRASRGINLVAEGRDMTTVVFPDAEVKVYLDADPAVRARRRFDQGTSGLTLGEIERTMAERDLRDRSKAEGALMKAPDAVSIDTSALTLDEVYATVSRLIRNHLQYRSQE